MVKPVLAALLLVPALALATNPPGAPRDGWARYSVPMAARGGGPCCYDISADNVSRRGCDLERGGGISVHTGGDTASPADGVLDVYLHYDAGVVDRIQAFASQCPVRAKSAPVALNDVSTGASIALLRHLAQQSPNARETSSGAILALAHHAGEPATDALIDLARAAPREARRDAVFWLAQNRGRRGAREVERIARGDETDTLREHAVFALSQTDTIDGYAAIADIARTDRSSHIRAQALFWMAQTGDPRARAAILTALSTDASAKVREQAVFALSQLEQDADAALIDVVRGDYPREAKKKALFWLGQSGSAEALAMLDDLLGSEQRRR